LPLFINTDTSTLLAPKRTVFGGTATDRLTTIAQTTTMGVPALVALPTSGTVTAQVTAIGSDLDPNNFSIEDDSDLIWGASAQPVSIP